MTPEQRSKHLKTIEKIEGLSRPAKWREIKKFVLALHPELKTIEDAHCEAVKEIRQKHESQTASSKTGTMRETMKLPNFLYDAMIKLDPELRADFSGRNRGAGWEVGQQLYKAFPEYRTARTL